MKRLLDETTDDFTRALLVAGIEQRPPAGSQRKVLLALGAGGALGLFSSHAVAWLGTSGGKVSLLGIALGMAGAVYAVSPWSETEASRGLGVPPAAVPSAAVPSAAVPPAAVPPAETAAPREPSPLGDAVPTAAPASEPSREPAVRARKSQARGARDRAARQAVSAAPAVAAPPEAEPPPESASLDAEVRLVDDMHWAARRNDREALARLVATYQQSFPHGQLEAEVSAFAARLERPTTP